MKILVTGANGYLGQGVVKALLDDGHCVIASDFSLENVDDRAQRIECNLFAVENPYVYFDRPDTILHMAWRDGFQHYSDAHIEDLPKHYLLLSRMVEAGIKKVCVIGSMHEIGFYEGCVSESTPCHPITPYGISKNALRDLTQMLAQRSGVVFQWLRGFYIVGNNKCGNSIFSKLAAAAENGQIDFPFTTGQNQYDFVDYEDFCCQVAAAVGQDAVSGIINICSGKPEKLADRVERFIKENHYNIKLNYGIFPDRPYDSKAIWADNSKIRSIMSAVAER